MEVTNDKTQDLDIMKSFNVDSEYKTVLQRYYTPMYCTNINDKKIEPHCVLFHSNRICLITVAPTHPIVKENKTIKKIDFSSGNIDRLQNQARGKSKRGGQKLEPQSLLCRVDCEDGTSYEIYSCIKGLLVEINKNITENPQLLVTRFNTDGHIAIVLADLSKISEAKQTFLSEEKYKEIC